MIDKAILKRIPVVPRFPNIFGADRGEPIPPDLVGATIVSVGTLEDPEAVEGGGLIIDYANLGEVKRLVLALNETGAWVIFADRQRATPTPASSPSTPA
jgi:hypothetical protein